MAIEVHLKKFFEDVYKDPTMYEDYTRDRLVLNRELYSKWYREMEIKNETFFRTIENINRPNKGDFVFESALSSELTLSKKIFGRKEIEVVPSGFPKIEDGQIGTDKQHYICNGCYETTLENIYRVLGKGSFTVGVCCEKKTDEFREIAKYYNALKDFLMKKGYSASSFESNISGKNRVYLLTYDSYKQKKK